MEKIKACLSSILIKLEFVAWDEKCLFARGYACNYQFSAVVVDEGFRWSVCLGIQLRHRCRNQSRGQQQQFPHVSLVKSSQQHLPAFIPQQQVLA